MGYQRKTVDIRVGSGRDEGVQYRLKAQPSLTKKAGDSRTALVQVVPRRNVGQAEILRRLSERSLVDEPMVRYVLDLLTDLMVSELKAGNTVTLNNYMTFGVSIPGRVSPQQPEDVKHLKLVPSVRFSPPFHRALNRNAKKQYLSKYQPPEVLVNKIEYAPKATALLARGRFHNIQSLQVELIIGDRVFPCEYELWKDKNSTRDLGKELVIRAKVKSLPAGDRTVRFTYTDASGATQTFTHPATVSTY